MNPAGGRGETHHTSQQHAVAWLRRAIVEGELRPGKHIQQDEIAERIGVSLIPAREALKVLEGEGQVTYIPRKGYFVSELHAEDLIEVNMLRELLEDRAARAAVDLLDDDALDRLEQAAEDCSVASTTGDVAAELAANRRFHFGIFEVGGGTHMMRLIRLLWESTEAYRAIYYNNEAERHAADEAHERILDAARARDADRLVAELDAHRDRALRTLVQILSRQEQ
ncbi:GntR family transcriptional regulator [Trujillonella humicola]|uniref:GntR family transcriptional regulator n=1 Tax=Trujillonella humicola TaxID=3383699 RepID=UPI003905B702